MDPRPLTKCTVWCTGLDGCPHLVRRGLRREQGELGRLQGTRIQIETLRCSAMGPLCRLDIDNDNGHKIFIN